MMSINRPQSTWITRIGAATVRAPLIQIKPVAAGCDLNMQTVHYGGAMRRNRANLRGGPSCRTRRSYFIGMHGNCGQCIAPQLCFCWLQSCR
ncbi:hypothetical protein BCAR13_1060108 [Paraburkholderia caribensis]|nr:hypothetical protein BCAR13_1060108 [Paraburkholderia caribensis]